MLATIQLRSAGFAPESDLSERVLFPRHSFQSNGIEDARFVRFHNEDGRHKPYYGDLQQRNERKDESCPSFSRNVRFSSFFFKFITLNGPAVEN